MGIAKCDQESFSCYIHLADNSSRFPPRSMTSVVSSGTYMLKQKDKIFKKRLLDIGVSQVGCLQS